MKSLIMTLVLLLSSIAFAGGAMDTTYVATTHGDTVKLIHERGLIPELTDEEKISLDISDEAIAAGIKAEGIDRYEDRIKYLRSHAETLSRQGGILAVLSGMGIVAFSGMFAYGLLADDLPYKEADRYVFWGMSLGLTSVAGATSGFFIWKYARNNLRKADKYEQKLQKFKDENSVVSLKFAPVVNPLGHGLGGNLALTF